MADDEILDNEGQEIDDRPFKASIGTELPDDPAPEPPKEESAPAVDDIGTLKQQLADLTNVIDIQKQVLEDVKRRPAPAPVYQQAPVPERQVTQEELNDLFATNPTAAAAYVAQRAVAEYQSNIDRRFGSWQQSLAQTTEANIRATHAEDFKDFGDDIAQVMSQATLEERSDPRTWDFVINTIKGRNVDKIVERRLADARAKELADAKAAEAARVGAVTGSPRSNRSPAPSTANAANAFGLTAEQQRQAKLGGISFEDYAKYARKG